MYSPELAYLEKTTFKETLTPAEKAVYQWYLKNPTLIKERVNQKQLKDMNEFSDVYGSVAIARDKKILSGKEKGEKKNIKLKELKF